MSQTDTRNRIYKKKKKEEKNAGMNVFLYPLMHYTIIMHLKTNFPELVVFQLISTIISYIHY